MNKKLLFLLPILLLSLCGNVHSMDPNFNEFFQKNSPRFSEEFYKPSEDEDDLFWGGMQQVGGWFGSLLESEFLDDPTPQPENMLNITDSPLPLPKPFFLDSPVRDSRFYNNEGNEHIKSLLKKVKKKKIKKKKKDTEKLGGGGKLAKKTTKKSCKKWKCDSKDCKEVFSSKRDLLKHKSAENHYAEKEKKESPWECNVCNRRYAKQKSLTRHQREKGHNPPERKRRIYEKDKKLWKCDVCGNSYLTKDSLHSHQRQKNHNPPARKRKQYAEKDKNFKCTYPGCNKNYYENGSLTDHKKKHKSWCQTCDKIFENELLFITHLCTGNKRSRDNKIGAIVRKRRKLKKYTSKKKSPGKPGLLRY